MATETYQISSFKTLRAFMKHGTCSESVMSVINRAFGHPLPAEEHAVMALAGGIAGQGYQCGMLWGACLAAGAEAYRRFGSGPRGEAAAMYAAGKLAEALREREGDVNCLEITQTDWNDKWQIAKFFIKGGTISCTRRVMRFAQAAYDVIEQALDEVPEAAPAGASSCAARVARQMGASEVQVVMAAGLAGGIGLSGSGCGALGARIWLDGIGDVEQPSGMNMMTPRIAATLERFYEVTDHEVTCADIVDHSFASIDDHTAHVRGGGCAKIIDVLAATATDATADSEPQSGVAA